MWKSCIVFSLVLALAHSACVLELDDENIFLSRMPGAWELDESLAETLAPNTYLAFNVSRLTLTRRDATAEESFVGEECDAGDFKLHMTGIAEATDFNNKTTEYGEIYIK